MNNTCPSRYGTKSTVVCCMICVNKTARFPKLLHLQQRSDDSAFNRLQPRLIFKHWYIQIALQSAREEGTSTSAATNINALRTLQPSRNPTHTLFLQRCCADTTFGVPLKQEWGPYTVQLFNTRTVQHCSTLLNTAQHCSAVQDVLKREKVCMLSA